MLCFEGSVLHVVMIIGSCCYAALIFQVPIAHQGRVRQRKKDYVAEEVARAWACVCGVWHIKSTKKANEGGRRRRRTALRYPQWRRTRDDIQKSIVKGVLWQAFEALTRVCADSMKIVRGRYRKLPTMSCASLMELFL